jgi:hypothetical protein
MDTINQNKLNVKQYIQYGTYKIEKEAFYKETIPSL